MSLSEALSKINEPVVDDTSLRQEGFEHVVRDFQLEADAEFFTNPEHRLSFISSLEFEEFIDLAHHVNTRMRGGNPRDETFEWSHSKLMMLATPHKKLKEKSLKASFAELQGYLETSTDPTDVKLEAASMAVEAMIIWTHPFDDGNGRTSRFFGKFLRDGTENLEVLEKAAVSKKKWQTYFPYKESPRLPEVAHHVELPQPLLADEELTREEVDPNHVLDDETASQLAQVLSMEGAVNVADYVFNKRIDWSLIETAPDRELTLKDILKQVDKDMVKEIFQLRHQFIAALPPQNVKHMLQNPEYRKMVKQTQEEYLARNAAWNR